jgi:ribosome-associated protein
MIMDSRLHVAKHIKIPLTEIDIHPIRSSGPGGQNVNKVASAVHLRFDIKASCLPPVYKKRLFMLTDRRITKDGIIIIKAQQHRNFLKNKQEALKRLRTLLRSVLSVPKKRKPSRPTHASQLKRLECKTRRGRLKLLRRKIMIR